MTYAQLEQFYEAFVTRARSRGITCAITSGMACVALGVAQTTKDCDLLCSPAGAGTLLELLAETALQDMLPSYRGNLTSPLDTRWLRGGWTSHFVWGSTEGEAYLDVFGVPPRASSPWPIEHQGFYAGPHTVAEMKRTARERDWPFATVLGLKLLERGDARGWLHLFNHDVLVQTAERLTCPAEMIARRPLLGLLATGDNQLEVALRGEIEFWRQLDRQRLALYERAARPYVAAVRGDPDCRSAALRTQHAARLAHAVRLLPCHPLKEHGIDALIAEAQAEAARFLPAGALAWLPDARSCFSELADDE